MRLSVDDIRRQIISDVPHRKLCKYATFVHFIHSIQFKAARKAYITTVTVMIMFLSKLCPAVF